MSILSRARQVVARGAMSVARAALTVGAGAPPAYPSAGQGPRFAAFRDIAYGVNAALLPELSTGRNRAHALNRSNSYVWKAIRTRVAFVVGNGLTPQSTVEDKTLRGAIETLWRSSTQDDCQVDADGLTNFAGLLVLLELARATPGECFARFRDRYPEDGLTVPLQVQLIEGAQVPHTYNERLSNGNVIRAGIEKDRIGRRRAVHIHPFHPDDADPLGDFSRDTVRIPAEDVLHVFMPTRPGQLRGEPSGIRIHQTARDYEIYKDGQVKKQQIGANHTGFLKIGDADAYREWIEDPNAPKTQWSPEFLSALPGGVDAIEWTKQPDVGQGFSEFNLETQRALAAGLLVPPWQLNGDYGAINYSSHRGGTVEQKRLCMQELTTVTIPQFCMPFWRRWFATAVRVGALPISPRAYAKDPRAFDRVKWVPTRWEWVDPLKEVTAWVIAIRAGLVSRDQVIAELGFDPEIVDQERKQGQQREDEAGLVSDSNAARTTQSGQLQQALKILAEQEAEEEAEAQRRAASAKGGSSAGRAAA